MFPVLKDVVRRRGSDLSGGQQQQLGIARKGDVDEVEVRRYLTV